MFEKNEQDIKNLSYFIKKTKDSIKSIKDSVNNFTQKIGFISNINFETKNLNDEITNYEEYLDSKKDNIIIFKTFEEYMKKIDNKFNSYMIIIKDIIDIFDSKSSEMKKLVKKIKESFKELKESKSFIPRKMRTLEDSKSYNDFSNSSINNNDSCYKKNVNSSKGLFNDLYEEENKNSNYSNKNNENLEKTKKQKFFDSISLFIINILRKCDYLLNNELINTSQIDYPFFENPNDIKTISKFIEDINRIFKENYKENPINDNLEFKINSYELRLLIKDILMKEERFMYIVNLIDFFDSSYSEKASYEDDIEDEIYEGTVINSKLKDFFFYINLISKKKYNSRNDINRIIMEVTDKMVSNFSINKNKILVNVNKFNIDKNLRLENFPKLPLNWFGKNFPNLNDVYEFRILTDEFFNSNNHISKYYDYRKNNIINNRIFKNNIKKVIELGLYNNINNKYLISDFNWTDAYYGLGKGKEISPDEMINKLKDILEKGFEQSKKNR